MADEQAVPNLNALVDQLVDRAFDPAKLTRLQLAIRNGDAEALTIAKALAYDVLDGVLEKLAGFFFGIEEHIEHVAAPPLARIVGHLLGVEVTTQELRQSATAGGDPRIGRLVADLALRALSSDATELKPGREGAEKFLTLIAQLVVNGWFEGTAFEMITTLFPDMDSFESVAELPEDLVDALGLGRLARVALRPLAQTLVATPLTWELNQKYAPSLLSEATAIEEHLSGNLAYDELTEELSRQGWSTTRIDRLIRNHTKQLGLDELEALRRHGAIGEQDVIDTLRESGYREDTARLRHAAALNQRRDAITDNALPSLLRAFVDGDLSESELATFLPAILYDREERDTWLDAARLQRENTHSHLTQAEVIACVKQGILPTAYYREWLTLRHYSDEEAIALELLLRTDIEKERSIDDHRKQIEAERAAEKERAAKDKAERLAKAEAERALARRGSLAELRRAAVRGLVPFARVEELLNAQYDPDFVATFLDLVEADRQDYLRQQEQRADAEKRAANRRIDIGALEQAFLNNVIDIDRFRQAVLDRGIVMDDANILTATLAARKADLDEAKQRRAEAEAAARNKSIDLGRMETLVRRGHRTIAEYEQLLEQLGFGDAARAGMVDLLELQIADDAAARAKREAAAEALKHQGVSLEAMRRAVILELATVDDYTRFLVDHGFTADAIALLVAEVQHDLDDARAARARREKKDEPEPATAIPLADVRRAARLGLIDVSDYQRRLEAAGYTADDIAIELDLLVQEIADVQAARQRQEAADAAKRNGLTLAQLGAAVRAGVKHLDDYRAAAASDPTLSRDDVATLVRVLADELAASDAARARRAAIGSTVKPADVSIGELEAQVRAGALSLPDYIGLLINAGLDAVDIDLLVSLLSDELTASGGT